MKRAFDVKRAGIAALIAIAIATLPAVAQQSSSAATGTGTGTGAGKTSEEKVVDKIVEDSHEASDGTVQPSTGRAEPTETWMAACDVKDADAARCQTAEKEKQAQRQQENTN